MNYSGLIEVLDIGVILEGLWRTKDSGVAVYGGTGYKQPSCEACPRQDSKPSTIHPLEEDSIMSNS